MQPVDDGDVVALLVVRVLVHHETVPEEHLERRRLELAPVGGHLGRVETPRVGLLLERRLGCALAPLLLLGLLILALELALELALGVARRFGRAVAAARGERALLLACSTGGGRAAGLRGALLRGESLGLLVRELGLLCRRRGGGGGRRGRLLGLVGGPLPLGGVREELGALVDRRGGDALLHVAEALADEGVRGGGGRVRPEASTRLDDFASGGDALLGQEAFDLVTEARRRLLVRLEKVPS